MKKEIEFIPDFPNKKIWETVRELCNCMGVRYHHHYRDAKTGKYFLEYFDQDKPKLTPKQKKFFSKPQSMQAVWKILFRGDAFEANNFQNWALNNNLIEWNGSTFKLPELK